MTEEKFITACGLIGQLNVALLGDDQCATLVDKLIYRLGILAAGDTDPGRLVEEMAKLPAVAALSSEQIRLAMLANIATLRQSDQRCSSKHAEYVEQIDTHRAYIGALEERCQDLTDEFKNSGGDVSKYPPIEKP